MEITFGSRFREAYYEDLISRLCTSSNDGWECETGERFDGKKVMSKYTFDIDWFDQNFNQEFSKIKCQYILKSF